MNQTAIITKLRDEYGFSSTTDYPDSKLIAYINSALYKISEIYPKILRDYVTTVVDQTRYSITKTGLMGIKAVYYCQSSEIIPVLSSDSTYRNSRQMASVIDMEIASKLTPSGAEIISHDTFDLIPTPTEIENVYYDYKVVRTLAELPDNFEEDILDLVAHKNADVKFKKSNTNSGMAGNPYKFDRRGNITEEPTSMVVETQKALKTDLDNIVRRIQTKVNRI